jgi:KDO2-lipid IV(A) lauroyltransferase
VERVNYLLFKLFGGVVKLLPKRVQSLFISTISTIIYFTVPKFRRRVGKNLNIVFGTQFTEKNLQRFSISCIKNILQNGITVIENLTSDEVQEKIIFQNREVVDKLLQEKKPIIFSSAHYGNWELLASTIGSQITPVVAVAKKIRNREINRAVIDSRERFGIEIVRSRGAVLQLSKAIKSGKSVYIMADQSVRGGKVYQIFGKDAKQSTTNSFLVKKLGATIIPTFIEKRENSYIVKFLEPIDNSFDGDITEQEIAILEEQIRENPESWLWCHNRWKR